MNPKRPSKLHCKRYINEYLHPVLHTSVDNRRPVSLVIGDATIVISEFSALNLHRAVVGCPSRELASNKMFSPRARALHFRCSSMCLGSRYSIYYAIHLFVYLLMFIFAYACTVLHVHTRYTQTHCHRYKNFICSYKTVIQYYYSFSYGFIIIWLNE